MKHGDISNHRGFVIGFRCEDCLLKFKDKHLGDKFANLLKGKAHNADIDQGVLSLMNYIYWDTEMTVSLIVDEKNYTKELEEFISNFPFNQIGLIFTNITEVTMLLNTGQLTYYVDSDKNRLLDVNSRFAITVEEMNQIVRRSIHSEVKKETI